MYFYSEKNSADDIINTSGENNSGQDRKTVVTKIKLNIEKYFFDDNSYCVEFIPFLDNEVENDNGISHEVWIGYSNPYGNMKYFCGVMEDNVSYDTPKEYYASIIQKKYSEKLEEYIKLINKDLENDGGEENIN